MANGVGCDIGGTFTDLIKIDEATGAISVTKVLTTPGDPSEAIERGLRDFDDAEPGCLRETHALVHGTTLVINAVIERKGAVTGLITTRGFRDVIEIGREKRYDGVDLQIRFPEPIVPRPLRVEIDERVHVSGRVLEPLSVPSVEAAIRELMEQGVESIAVCLLNSYANPVHEEEVRRIAARLAPKIAISLSFEVLRELKEYERSTTTAINAYTMPIVSKYLGRLETRLDDMDCRTELLLMQSSGGLSSVENVRRFPVQVIESGPAAGVIAAAHYARILGEKTVLAFDMGGTTAKMCLIANGKVTTTTEIEVDRVHRFKLGSGIPVRLPVVDLMEIGAGGGSIAQMSAKGTLEVGPRSSGAVPGPVCYGRGGTDPTVSDADLVLGYLNPEYFLGGRMSLGKAGSENVISEKLAKPLRLSVVDAAWGVHSVVNENMANAAKVYVAEKGYSPSACAIVAFGGAGPVHACDLAHRIGAGKVIVLPRAGVASAFGMLISPLSCGKVKTHRTSLSRADFKAIEHEFGTLEKEARAALPRTAAQDAVWFERTADMRYVGQGYEVSVPIEGSIDTGDALQQCRVAFNRIYQQLYGRVFDTLEIEIINLRVTAFAPGRTYKEAVGSPEDKGKPVAHVARNAFCNFARDFVPFKVYRRGDVPVGYRIAGPAIIEEPECATIVSADGVLEVDASGALVISLGEAGQEVQRGSQSAVETLDPVSLEMLWRRISGSVDELAAALVRTSFSTVVRDVKDYACAIFDDKARLLVQSMDSTPGIAGGLSPMLRHMLEKYPVEKLNPGDVLVGNDPWNGSGHHNDIFLITPAFHQGKVIGFAACAAHHVDIGGRRATTESRDNYEEGLRIPVGKIVKAGEDNEVIFAFIRSNVRLADTVIGDLRAQFAANYVGCERLIQLCAERGWADLHILADEIVGRSAAIAEAAIEKIPDGIYAHEAPIAIYDGREIVLKLRVTVSGNRITADFSGSSPQVGRAINCTHTYTSSYANFAIAALLALPVPTNEGSLSPVTIIAEPGTVLNAKFPAPTFARTSIGNFLPEMIFMAMAEAMPDQVIAASGATPLWAQYIIGTRKDGSQFAPLNSAHGGLGARAHQDGVSCLTFPVNIGNIPAEVLESEVPLIVKQRALWPDSAGAGRHRGGLGQVFELEVLDGDIGPGGPLNVGFRGGRFVYPVPGLLNGGPTPTGKLKIDDKDLMDGGDVLVRPGGSIVCRIPGGGGLGDPRERDPALIRRDLRFGYITPQHAREAYRFDDARPAARRKQ